MLIKKVKIPGGRIEIEYGLRKIGEQSPYFTITGTTYKGRWPQSCGAIHDDILKYSKGLSDMIKMHLRDISGSPMYPVENGHFYYERIVNDNDSKYVEVLSDHLMIPVEECKQLIIEMQSGDSKRVLQNKIEEMKPIWMETANKIINKYNLTV